LIPEKILVSDAAFDRITEIVEAEPTPEQTAKLKAFLDRPTRWSSDG
jgi:hypothetical protein